MVLFGSRLRQRAAELGISNAEAARRAGLDERRYAHYVRGMREPDLATLLRIAQVLATSPNSLLGFGEASVEPASSRNILEDRLILAARSMSEQRLEMMVVQAEAVAAMSKP